MSIMQQSELAERLAATAARVEAKLPDRFSWASNEGAGGICPATLKEAQDYSLMAGGKRIRPFLVLEVCHMLGGDENNALPLACAIEMIHTYSLIHDDLPCMDNDDLRRGKPTSHKAFGEAMAILSGDGLLTDAFMLAASLPEAERAQQAVRVLAEAAGSMGMVGGQVMDLEGETRQLSPEELLQLHAQKTGALIRAAVWLGAIAAGECCGSPVWKALTTYAERIGLAFQVVDDVLDVTADATLLGKSKGKDQAVNKTTFLTYDTVDEAKAYAARLTDEAVATVAPIDRDGSLQALAEYLANRVY
jgi:geranylgeranyl diphosphate synthase type II